MRPRDVVRIDRDHLAKLFNRMVVPLQPETGLRLAAITIGDPPIVGAQPNRLVEIFNTLSNSPRRRSTQAGVAVRVGRVQGKRALEFGDGFVVAPLGLKDPALPGVSQNLIWIEGERLGLEFVGPLQVAFRVTGKAKDRTGT